MNPMKRQNIILLLLCFLLIVPSIYSYGQETEKKEYSKRTFNWNNYLDYMHGQVEELVKNYGKLDILWTDFSFDNYSGEKWKAKELVEMVRKNQPDIILSNRLVINHNIGAAERMITSLGDFETPEQGIPDAPLMDKFGNQLPWETCLTMNNSWGYTENDHSWKSPERIIHRLVNCVSNMADKPEKYDTVLKIVFKD